VIVKQFGDLNGGFSARAYIWSKDLERW
jgi:hypothetical protein